MDYATARANAVRTVYAGRIAAFSENYRVGRPTVVVLPGGMGSQLDRSRAPFDGSAPEFSPAPTVWMDPGIFFDGDGLKLEIDAQDRDIGDYVIIPDGPLRYLFVAYDGTEAWALGSDFNYVVFGFDWRRPIEEAAGFLEDFLALLRDTIRRVHSENPLPTTTLLAHSQGGLAAKVFLHRISDMAAWCARLITVATPFYGTSTHMQRYYVGQSPLDILHGSERVARIIATLPGPYALLPIDRPAFDADFARLGFPSASDYPVTDPVTGAAVDPYDAGNLNRYPSWLNADHLERARRIRRTIAAPLPAAMLERTFNIRAVANAGERTRLEWGQLPANFDPRVDDAPIEILQQAGSDGTVPGWSAWLAQIADPARPDLAAHRIQFEGPGYEHGDMLEHVDVLNRIGPMIDPGYAPVTAPAGSRLYGPQTTERASSAQVRDFASDVTEGRAGRTDPRAHSERMWRGLAREFKR